MTDWIDDAKRKRDEAVEKVRKDEAMTKDKHERLVSGLTVFWAELRSATEANAKRLREAFVDEPEYHFSVQQVDEGLSIRNHIGKSRSLDLRADYSNHRIYAVFDHQTEASYPADIDNSGKFRVFGPRGGPIDAKTLADHITQKLTDLG